MSQSSFAIILVGAILVVFGLYLVLPPIPVTGEHQAIIPAGNYYYHIDFNIVKAGQISGTFSEQSGIAISLYILSQTQYQIYTGGGSVTSMFAISGVTGKFSTHVLSPGHYYIVLSHGSNSLGLTQNVQVSYLLDEINPVFLASGLGFLIAGAGIIYLGYLRSKSSMVPAYRPSELWTQPA